MSTSPLHPLFVQLLAPFAPHEHPSHVTTVLGPNGEEVEVECTCPASVYLDGQPHSVACPSQVSADGGIGDPAGAINTPSPVTGSPSLQRGPE